MKQQSKTMHICKSNRETNDLVYSRFGHNGL